MVKEARTLKRDLLAVVKTEKAVADKKEILEDELAFCTDKERKKVLKRWTGNLEAVLKRMANKEELKVDKLHVEVQKWLQGEKSELSNCF